MSYILDALKKSEREKTLGQVPTLESVVSDGAKKQRSGTPWWLNLIVFFVALIAVFGILKMAGLIDFSRSENTVSQQTAQPATAKNDAGSGSTVAQSAVSDPATGPSPRLLTQTDQNNEVVMADEQSTASAAQIEDIQAPPDPARETVEPGEAESDAQVAYAVAEDEVQQAGADENPLELEERFAAQEAEELAALALQLESQEQQMQQQLSEANSDNGGQQQASVDQQSQPQYEEVIHDSLRDISVNVVSYSSDSRQRFIMLDLTIYKEGDQLANNAQIIEIIRNGAIVEFQNKRYLLKP